MLPPSAGCGSPWPRPRPPSPTTTSPSAPSWSAPTAPSWPAAATAASSADPTAHAELEALRRRRRPRHLAPRRLRPGRHPRTLPPCAGALVQARIATLIFGADDPKAGAVTSLFDLVRDPRLPHRVEVHRGILAADCADLLGSFFTPAAILP